MVLIDTNGISEARKGDGTNRSVVGCLRRDVE